MSFKTNGQDFDERYVRFDELGINLLNFGRLYSTGNNANGQLGTGDTIDQRDFVPISEQREWKLISIGCLGQHNVAINNDKEMYTWGVNSFGQLGLSTVSNTDDETRVGLEVDWDNASAGQDNTLAVNDEGEMWQFGKIINPTTGAIEASSSPIQVGSLKVWSKVFAGNGTFQNFAIDKYSKLWAWGNNANGQLGLGDVVTRSVPTQVGANNNWFEVSSSYHTIALTKQGRLFAWGSNTDGQLGLNDVVPRSSPVQIGALTSWVQATSGKSHTVALRYDGSIWVWGKNDYGQLGTGDVISRSSPVQMGSSFDWMFIASGADFSLALKADGTLWAWGKNTQGQLGTGGLANTSVPLKIGALDTWKMVDAGSSHSTAILGF